jgi:hypothetical protein
MHKTSMKLDPMKQGVSWEKSLLHTDDFVLLTIKKKKKKPCIFSGATPLQMFEVKGWTPWHVNLPIKALQVNKFFFFFLEES